MNIPMLKTGFTSVFIALSTVIFAQDAPKDIYELYNITKGGCSFQDIIDSGKPLTGQVGGSGSSPDWPEPNVSASENIEEMLIKYREYLKQQPFQPVSVRKLKNGNELFLEDNLWGLRTSSGIVLQKPQFQYIEAVNDKLRAFRNGACEYLDGLTGKSLLPQSYLYIKEIAKEEYLVRTKNGYGLIKEGKSVIENTHRSISPTKTGNRFYYTINNSFALLDDFRTRILPGMGITYLDNDYVLTSENIIDIKGRKKLICEEQKFYFSLLNIDPAIFSIKRSGENFSFMIDIKGNLLSTQAFSNILPFSKSGLASASVSKQDAGQPKNMSGLINLKGEWVVQPEYQWTNMFYSYWWAKPFQGQELIFHLDGKPVLTEENHLKKYSSIKPFSTDFAIASKQTGDQTQKDIVKITTGKAIQKDVSYESVSTVNRDKVPCQEPRYIAASKEGEQVLDENFAPITPLRKRYVYAGKNFEATNLPPSVKTVTLFDCNGKALAFDVNGKKEETFKNIYIVNDSILYACLANGTPCWRFGNGKTQVLDKEIGNIAPFGIKDLYLVASTYPEHKGVINSKGETIIPMQLKTFTPIAQPTGITIFETFGGSAGLLDSQGNLVNNILYKEVQGLVFDLYLVSNNDKYGVINHQGREILPLRYQKIHWSDGIITAKDGTKDLFFDISGKLLE